MFEGVCNASSLQFTSFAAKEGEREREREREREKCSHTSNNGLRVSLLNIRLAVVCFHNVNIVVKYDTVQ